MISVPHFEFPLRMGPGGRLSVLEQDTPDEIAQAVLVLLSTIEGERIELPEYGIEDPLFTIDLDLNMIRQAIEEWEPRASAILEEQHDSLDDMIRHLRAKVSPQ